MSKLRSIESVTRPVFEVAVQNADDPASSEQAWRELTRSNSDLAKEIVAEARRTAEDLSLPPEAAALHMARVVLNAVTAAQTDMPSLETVDDLMDSVRTPSLPPAA